MAAVACQNAAPGREAQAVVTKKRAIHRPLEMYPLPGLRALTLDGDIVHRQLQTLATPHHPHRVPLVVVELVARKERLRAFTCGTKGGVSTALPRARIWLPVPPQARTESHPRALRTHSLRHVFSRATHPHTRGHTLARWFHTPSQIQITVLPLCATAKGVIGIESDGKGASRLVP